MSYFELEKNAVTKDQYYLANIAKTVNDGFDSLLYVIQAALCKKKPAHPRKTKIEDFVLKFHQTKEEQSKTRKSSARGKVRKTPNEYKVESSRSDESLKNQREEIADNVIQNQEELDEKNEFLFRAYQKYMGLGFGMTMPPELIEWYRSKIKVVEKRNGKG